MAKTAYNIQLKGYVGGRDFDRADVNYMLAKNEGKTVKVLIDSFGGSLATGLSISALGLDAVFRHPDIIETMTTSAPRNYPTTILIPSTSAEYHKHLSYIIFYKTNVIIVTTP